MLYRVHVMCDECDMGRMCPDTRNVDAADMKEAREMVEYHMRAWNTPGYVTSVEPIPGVTKEVRTVCYNEVRTWADRMEAIKFYKQGWMECDGAEAERYQQVYSDLWAGSPVGWDGVSEGMPEIDERNAWFAAQEA